MGTSLKIGELARVVGCTVKAVRFYEAKGLLPRAARARSGYRLYTEQDLKRLAFIQRAKLMGLSLGKIKDLAVHLSEKECACPKIRPHLERLIREQLKDIATKIEQFALLKKEIEGFLAKMGRAKQALPAELWRAPGDGSGRASLPRSVDAPPKRELRPAHRTALRELCVCAETEESGSGRSNSASETLPGERARAPTEPERA